ncbi:MAG: ATP-binding protein, partial [Bacilli bacterium]|nr:ATP-binding protein [Bacilli bacterium]
RALESSKIKEIIDRMDGYAQIINLDQMKALNFAFDFDLTTTLVLKDYDSVANQGNTYRLSISGGEGVFSWDYHQYNYVLPVIRYDEIEGDSRVMREDEDTITVEYGRGFTTPVKSSDTLRRINVDSMKGEIVESDRKITIFIDKDGNKTQLRVYKNEQTGEEYVFMKKKEDGTIDDSLDVEATFVGIVSPLTWTVDKSTRIAICNNPLFFSESCRCDYEKSALKAFLESDEFMAELGVDKKKTDTKKVNNGPFGEKKKVRLTTEQQIRRLLIGGKRIPYLVGHPGVGKSQIAKSISKYCCVIEVSHFTPDAFTGKTSTVPGDKTIIHDGDKTYEHSEPGTTTTSEPKWHVDLVEKSEEARRNNERCVLFIDEFDKLTPNMQVFINGIVSDPRTIAGWDIPDNVDIILAGNTEEYSDAAFKISGEVESRLITIEVKPNIVDWLRWAAKHGIDPVVRAYLHNFPNKLIQDVMGKNGEYDYSKSLTPRSWDQKINQEILTARDQGDYPILDKMMDQSSLESFEEFISLYSELGIEKILKGDFPLNIFDLTHDKIQIIINCLIATASTEEELYNALLFIRKNHLNEYEALFEKRWSEINNSDEDIMLLKLAKSSLDERRTNYGK